MKQVKENRVLAFAIANLVAALVLTTACNFIINKATGGSASQGQSVSGANGFVDDAKDPLCRLVNVDMGFVNDDDEIAPGQSTRFSITLTGEQGLELIAGCRAKFTPAFSLQSSPTEDQCTLVGAGFDTRVRANDTAVVGTNCSTVVSVDGQESNPAVAKVVAP